MSAQHTPSPWQVAPGFHQNRVEDSDGIAVGVAWGRGFEAEANARLIAAAPGLLAALEDCLNFIANTEGEFGETLSCGDKARAAIAKAKGQQL